MKFEFDVSEMDAGDAIEQSECEKLVNFKRATDRYEYQFRLLQLVNYVQKALRKAGKYFTVIQKDGALLILTHEQASKYNAKTFKLGLRRSRRSFNRLMAVETESLSVEAREQHTTTIAAQSRIIYAISRRATDTKPEASKRMTPKITRAV